MKKTMLLLSFFAILFSSVFSIADVQAEPTIDGSEMLLAVVEVIGTTTLTEAQIAQAAAAAAAQTGGTIMGITVTAGTVTVVTVAAAVTYVTVTDVIAGTTTTTAHP